MDKDVTVCIHSNVFLEVSLYFISVLKANSLLNESRNWWLEKEYLLVFLYFLKEENSSIINFSKIKVFKGGKKIASRCTIILEIKFIRESYCDWADFPFEPEVNDGRPPNRKSWKIKKKCTYFYYVLLLGKCKHHQILFNYFFLKIIFIKINKLCVAKTDDTY